jgi:predicted nuclease of predicted toxin-antitoxin system
MRLLLDAHISGRRVGRALAELGHEVRAADEEEDLRGLEDADLLALAVSEGRILVTFDAKDFLPLLVERTAGGSPHAGCILVPGSFQHEHFGPIIAGIEGAIGGTHHEDWVDRVEWLESRRRT